MTNYKILNPAVALKPECHKCGYLNPQATAHYKCAVAGSCPAVSPKKKS